MTRASNLAVVLLFVSFVAATLWAPYVTAAIDPDAESGSVPLLVITRVDLTPEVVADIAIRTVRVRYVWPEIRAMAITMNEAKIPELAADPRIEVVEADGTGRVAPGPVDGTARTQTIASLLTPTQGLLSPIQTWNQDMADTPGSGYSGAGVTVAVVDAGLPQNWQEFLPDGCVDLEHAVGFGAEGWGDPHSELTAIHGTGGHIGLFPHGLAVSSVIAGFPSPFGPIGGSAPGAKILPVRVLNQFNFGWFSWFTAGIMYVANLKASGAVPGPMVINFSIQAGGSSSVLTAAIDYAISQGVLFVTIAGNFNPTSFVAYPGRLPQSITAGAVGWQREGLSPQPWFFGDVAEDDASQVYVASFSCREAPSVAPASQIDVVAPGSYVFGEWLFGPGFSEGREVAFDALDNFIFGTSFAAPHVAGIVAQMLEKNPGLAQGQAEAILRSTALAVPPSPAFFVTPLGEGVPPWDARATGTGIVRGDDAVAATPAAAWLGGGVASLGRGSAIGARDGLALRLASTPGALPARFEVRARGVEPITVAIFDVQGRLVRRWTGLDSRGVTLDWDGRGADGRAVGAGIFFARAEGSERSASTKFMVAR